MTISMYQASVPVFVQTLTALSGVLDRAAAHAAARKIEPTVLLNTRLIPDMFSLARQVKATTDHALSAGRIAGVELPKLPDDESSFEALKDRIAKTVDFLKSLKPAQIDGTEDKDITIPLGREPRVFKGQALLLGFSTPNFYFHATTAYAILRSCGVDIGKRDFMGTPRPA
jgi:uncharacterized protein